MDSINPIVFTEHQFQSLDRIKEYSTTYVLPDHGELITNLAERIAEMSPLSQKVATDL